MVRPKNRHGRDCFSLLAVCLVAAAFRHRSVEAPSAERRARRSFFLLPGQGKQGAAARRFYPALSTAVSRPHSAYTLKIPVSSRRRLMFTNSRHP